MQTPPPAQSLAAHAAGPRASRRPHAEKSGMHREGHGRRQRTLSSIFSRGWQHPMDANTTPGCVGRLPDRGTEPGGPRDMVGTHTQLTGAAGAPCSVAAAARPRPASAMHAHAHAAVPARPRSDVAPLPCLTLDAAVRVTWRHWRVQESFFFFFVLPRTGDMHELLRSRCGQGRAGGAAAGPAPGSTGVRDERGVDGRAGAGV